MQAALLRKAIHLDELSRQIPAGSELHVLIPV
jgi:hypothetical protein